MYNFIRVILITDKLRINKSLNSALISNVNSLFDEV